MNAMTTYPVPGMKTEAMKHQFDALQASEGKRNFAYLMEQGCGKTWTTLADVARAFLAGKIDGLLIVAPNGVHTNWILREIPQHLAIPTICEAWRGRPTSKKARARLDRLYADHYEAGKAPLRVFAINIDAVNASSGYEEVEKFLTAFPRTIMVVDESTRIKNPQAQRSKKVVKLGTMATARRILSGTPLTRAPTDLFMQYQFLREGILGTKSYRAFTSEFAVLLDPDDPEMIAIMKRLDGKSRVPPQVVKKDENGMPMFRNLEKLQRLIAPHSFRVTKKDALPYLPDKVYKVKFFELTPKQREVYQRVEEDYEFLLKADDFLMNVSFEAIAARTKLKQVTSGFINIYGEPVLLGPEDNPRMREFKELVGDLLDDDPERQIIVWAVYEQEILQIQAALEGMGISCRTYYGDTKKGDREENIDDFQSGKYRVFIGHAAAAGIGITLTAADTAIYYSVNFDNELRMQSEDRNHRIGTKTTVTYWDLVAEDTIDLAIQRSLEMKTQLARFVIDGTVNKLVNS
jgi:SNF2 family DNA or RNA helicase